MFNLIESLCDGDHRARGASLITLEAMNNWYKRDLIREIFTTVYQWGRVGLVVNHTATTYQKLIKNLME